MALLMKEVTLVPSFTYGHHHRVCEFEEAMADAGRHARNLPRPSSPTTSPWTMRPRPSARPRTATAAPSRWWSTRDPAGPHRRHRARRGPRQDSRTPTWSWTATGSRRWAPDPPPAVQPDDRVVDLRGRTVMPGMVNCHFHATYHELGSTPAPFGLEEPMAMQAVRAVNSLGLLLESGFTSAVSAGAPFAIDASMKVAIDRGLIPGPRLVPCSRDVSTTGHAGDRSYPPHWQVGALGAIRPSDGPDEFRRSVRAEIKEGAEFIKMFVTGGHGTIGPKEQLEMTRDEMAAGIEAAHLRGARVRGHIANRQAIHMALDLEIDVIDHGDGLDDECIERIVAIGDSSGPLHDVPGPVSPLHGRCSLGFTDEMKADLDAMAEILPKANAAGVRLVLGDDYGAVGFPHGPLRRGAGLLQRRDRDPDHGRHPVGHQARGRADGSRTRARHGDRGQAGRSAGGGR